MNDKINSFIKLFHIALLITFVITFFTKNYHISLFLLFLIIILLPYSLNIKNFEISPLTIALVFFFAFYFLRFISIYMNSYKMFKGYTSEHYFLVGQIISCIGLASFLLGYFSTIPVKFEKNKKILNFDQNANPFTIYKKLFLIMIGILLFVGTISVFVYMNKIVVAPNFYKAQKLLKYSPGSGGSVLIFGINYIPVSYILIHNYYKNYQKNSYLWKIFTFIIFIYAIIVSLMIGSRGSMLIVLFYLFLYYNYANLKSVRYYNIFGILLIPLLIILGYIRTSLHRYGYINFNSWSGNFSNLANNFTKDFISSDLLFLYLEKIPYTTGYTFGTSFTDAIISVFPRFFWANKPLYMGPDSVLASIYPKYLASSHVGPSIMPDLFLNFGAMGVAIGMFVFGFVTYLIETKSKMTDNRTLFVLLYFIYTYWVFKAGFYTCIPRFLIIYFIPIFVVIKLNNYINNSNHE